MAPGALFPVCDCTVSDQMARSDQRTAPPSRCENLSPAEMAAAPPADAPLIKDPKIASTPYAPRPSLLEKIACNAKGLLETEVKIIMRPLIIMVFALSIRSP